ncbi:MAG: Holliday junction resolvase RuvX [Oscillospiraceae bacterium]|nr:Holliday junction resolvase RuvX [Oscillospiraceae bacterium]
MKIMAIDYGDARTGVAISDALGMLVGTTTVIQSRNRERTAQQIADMIKETGAQRLVMGFPRNMDGTEGPRAELYREFAALLHEVTGLEPVLWDERRTTIEAHQILSDHNYHGKKRKNTVDAVAASLILEGYLSYLSMQKG